MELQRSEAVPTLGVLPFAEGEELTPAPPPGDPAMGKLWQAIASSAVMRAPESDKLKAIEPLLATVKQKATAARALDPPNLAELCGTFAGLFKRLPTGIPSLDAYTGGGLQTSRVVVIGGAPGAHKTSLLTSIAYQWARQGVCANGQHHEVLVVIFATDEPRHGFLSRIGQIEGLVRADLDDEDTTISGPAWATVGERLQAVPNLMIFDSRFDAVTVEELVEMAAERAQGRRVVFIVDSLHSAPFRSDAEGHEGPRAKIEARVKAAVNLAIKHRVCFIATSELNRGSYRSRAQADQVADLAAFKESSGIEYGADLGILLRSVPEEQNKVIEVSIAKNRMGDSDVTFRLERGAHFTYTEAPMPEGEGGRGRRGEDADDEGRRQRKILEVIRLSPEPLRSASDVYRITKGTKTAILASFRKLMDEGRIVSVNGALRVAMPKETAREESFHDETPSDRFERFEPVREPPNRTAVKPVRAVRAPVGGEPPNRTDGGDVIEPAAIEPVDEPADEPATGDPLASVKAAILGVLQAHPGAPNLDAMRLYTGRDFPAWKLRLAWIELGRGGAIENRGTAKAPSWWMAKRSDDRAPP